MDIAYHTAQIKHSITEYNKNLQSSLPIHMSGNEEHTYQEKEYKMPFEMKVFQKRLKKHLFYRSQKKNLVQKKTEEIITVPFNDEETETTSDEHVKWSALTSLQQKKAIVQFIQQLQLEDSLTTQTLIRQVWDAVTQRFIKSKHVTYNTKKKVIENIHGLEQRDHTWAFNVAALF